MNTPSDERHERVSQDMRRLNQARGFDPELPIHEFFGCFTVKQAKKSLFASTRSAPIPVYLTDDQDESARIPVVLDMARPLYHPLLKGDEEWPDWYFEGWVPPGYVFTPVLRRIRIAVSTLDGPEFVDDDMFHWQEITQIERSSGSSLIHWD